MGAVSAERRAAAAAFPSDRGGASAEPTERSREGHQRTSARHVARRDRGKAAHRCASKGDECERAHQGQARRPHLLTHRRRPRGGGSGGGAAGGGPEAAAKPRVLRILGFQPRILGLQPRDRRGQLVHLASSSSMCACGYGSSQPTHGCACGGGANGRRGRQGGLRTAEGTEEKVEGQVRGVGRAAHRMRLSRFSRRRPRHRCHRRRHRARRARLCRRPPGGAAARTRHASSWPRPRIRRCRGAAAAVDCGGVVGVSSTPAAPAAEHLSRLSQASRRAPRGRPTCCRGHRSHRRSPPARAPRAAGSTSRYFDSAVHCSSGALSSARSRCTSTGGRGLVGGRWR